LKKILLLWNVSAAILASVGGVVRAADATPPNAPQHGITEMILPDSDGHKNVDSNGSLRDEKGNRVNLKGNKVKTMRKSSDKKGHQLDQNGIPIENGLDSRLTPPKKK
jgi:hypothetical protein